ncbi:unnamed protein product [Urochloa humidicola]
MVNPISGLARGDSSSQGSGDVFAAVGVNRKGKKNRAPSPVLVSEEREAAGTETTSPWTGEKKTKIQSAPTSGDLSGTEQIEGLDWDEYYLEKEIDSCLERLHEVLPYDPDGEFCPFDEQQQKALNEQLALCRIRAYENDCQELEGASLTDKYPTSELEHNGYYKHYERYFEWYFDPEYCEYADIQDYQRLVLRDNGEYEDWEKYRKTCNKLEGDQQFVQLWDKLSSKTKLIELYLSNSSSKPPIIERLVFYHALKIAAGLPHVSKTLVCSTFKDFIWGIRFEHTWYKYYADFFFEMWQLITKQKMNFTKALMNIHKEGRYRGCTFAWRAELEKKEPNLSRVERECKSYLDRIVATANDDEAYQSIMDFIEEIVRKPKTYYDYAKKKLHIAKEIGLVLY